MHDQKQENCKFAAQFPTYTIKNVSILQFLNIVYVFYLYLIYNKKDYFIVYNNVVFIMMMMMMMIGLRRLMN